MCECFRLGPDNTLQAVNTDVRMMYALSNTFCIPAVRTMILDSDSDPAGIITHRAH